MEQVKELQGEQDAGMRTLTEGNQSSFIWNLTRSTEVSELMFCLFSGTSIYLRNDVV